MPTMEPGKRGSGQRVNDAAGPLGVWRCYECGASGQAATYAMRAAYLEAHWLARHQEVPWA